MKISEVTSEQASVILKFFNQPHVKGLVHYSMQNGGDPAGLISFDSLPFANNAESLFGKGTKPDGIYKIVVFYVYPSEKARSEVFLFEAVKQLKESHKARAVVSYANDPDPVYQHAGFQYYGFTESKRDFYARMPDGSLKRHSKAIGGIEGEWIARPIKHRFILTLDNALWPKYNVMELATPVEEQAEPKPEPKPKREDPQYPVVKIKKSDLFAQKYESLGDLMNKYRELSIEEGLIYDNSFRIGIRTWSDEQNFYLTNYKIEHTLSQEAN